MPASSPAKRSLVLDWRETFRTLGVHAISPAPRIRLGTHLFLRCDFYLSAARQFVLVDPSPSHRAAWIIGVAHELMWPRPFTDDACPDIPIVIAGSDGDLLGFERGLAENGPHELALCRCRDCLLWWCAVDSASWRCQCCGHHNGNAGLLAMHGSPIDVFAVTAGAESRE